MLQRKVDALHGQVIVDFSAGENHSLAVNEFGDVLAWCVLCVPIGFSLDKTVDLTVCAAAGVEAKKANWV